MMIVATLLIDKKTLLIYGFCNCNMKSEYDDKDGRRVVTMLIVKPSAQPRKIPKSNFAAKLPMISFEKWG